MCMQNVLFRQGELCYFFTLNGQIINSQWTNKTGKGWKAKNNVYEVLNNR